MEVNRKPPSTIRLFFILVAMGVGCIGSVLLAADLQCAYDIDAWAPLYPSAETVSTQYDFVRPRAMGVTQIIQISTDDVETVKQFYRDNNIANMDESRGRGLAATDWRAQENPDGEGTQILLYSACGI